MVGPGISLEIARSVGEGADYGKVVVELEGTHIEIIQGCTIDINQHLVRSRVGFWYVSTQ